MTLLHYVVSHPSVHPFRWHNIGLILQRYTFFIKVEQSLLKTYAQFVVFSVKIAKECLKLYFIRKNVRMI